MRRTLAIRNDLAELDSVLEWVNAIVADGGLPENLSGELFLIAEEVLANTITYGYEDDDVHRIEIEAALADGILTLVFRDDARAYDPLSALAPDLESPIGDRPIGGLGVHLVRTIADDVRYTRESGKNVLTVEKSVSETTIPPEEKP